MEKPCDFFEAVLSEKNQRVINRLVFLGPKEAKELKDHISECSTCQQTIKEIRATGSDLTNVAIDTRLGGNVGRS